MKIISSRISMVAVVVAASVITTFSSLPASAAAQTCTWTGVGGDNKFSTATNWSGCGTGAPQTGDNVVFDTADVIAGSASSAAITNDSNPQLAKVTIYNGSATPKTIYLSQLTLASNGIVERTGTGAGTALIVVGVPNPTDPNGQPTLAPFVVKGDYTLAPYRVDSAGLIVEGVLNVNQSSPVPVAAGDATSLYVDGSSVGGYNISGVKFYLLSNSSSVNVSAPMTLGEGAFLGFLNPGLSSQTWNISSNVTINSTQPVPVSVDADLTVKFTGTISDPAKLTRDAASAGQLVIGNTALVAVEKSTDVIGTDDTRNISVAEKETTTLAKDSVVNTVTVYKGGLLKGLGNAKSSIIVYEGGSIAPGLSPGCITTAMINLMGTYQFELSGVDPCSGYDQIKVTDTTQAAAPVVLGAESILSTVRMGTFTPKQGQVFTIIDVTGSKPVSGTFKGLAEGATFTQNGIVFKISYKGGDGNDVTLTIQNKPTVPNTGFELIRSSPMVSLAAGVLGAISLLVIARRLRTQRR